jgi:SAM-dependent methyltransferase
MIGEGNTLWEKIPLSESTRAVFDDLPGVAERIRRLFHDPILTEQGDLTETRNYGTYAREMASVVDLKYNEIKDFLLPGKIVDEGCADGVLIERIAQEYPDSDIIGVDLSAEMLARASEAQRAGAFGDAFVFFKQQNLMTPISEAQKRSVDTIICNSTLHELWSYGEREASVRSYLRNKIEQLKPGGRLVIRDVVGPEQGDQTVHLWCNAGNGTASGDVAALSTRALFVRFAQDFLPCKIAYTVYREDETSDPLFALSLRDAMEFITTMSYTDNWASEMHEQFCFWSFSDWLRELTDVGFSVIPESHAYVNPWRVDNQFQGRVLLFDTQGNPLPFPVTNMVFAGERPVNLPE